MDLYKVLNDSNVNVSSVYNACDLKAPKEVLQEKVAVALWRLEHPWLDILLSLGIFTWCYVGLQSFVVTVGILASIITNDRSLLVSFIGDVDAGREMHLEFWQLFISMAAVKFFAGYPHLYLKTDFRGWLERRKAKTSRQNNGNANKTDALE